MEDWAAAAESSETMSPVEGRYLPARTMPLAGTERTVDKRRLAIIKQQRAEELAEFYLSGQSVTYLATWSAQRN